MVDAVLHTGAEHPELTWILVSSVLAFVAGLGLGVYRDRIRSLLASTAPSTTER